MKKYLPVIYIAITAVFIGVALGFLLAKESGHTTIVLARQWQNKYSVTETVLPVSAGLVNINSANADKLCQLPGIGEGTAEKIIAYRQEHGAFIEIEDLMKIEGIGKTKFEKIRDYITVKAGE